MSTNLNTNPRATRKKIVISEFIDPSAVAALSEHFDVHADASLVDQPVALNALLADADALIVRNRTQVRAALLDAAPRLSVVGRLGVGLDNIDLDACAQRNVSVFPATGANARAVAEYVLATALMLLRGAYRSSMEVAAGKWPRAALSNGREAAGSTLAVIGFGGIGQLVAQLARALGMQVVAYDPLQPADAACWAATGARRVTIDEAWRAADVITLHVPLVDSTRNLLGASQLAALKRHAIIVNTSRGGIVDEAALALALREGRIGGAALDVFDDEPLAARSPLADAPNLILTPHIAGLTMQSNERVSTLVAARVTEALLAQRDSHVTEGISR
ncbi:MULTISPECIES: hydroxyacid dehydrogenase [Paraburkholderia]|uniref:hydroxyacid dehydrogenase n=1 Tax=Paraburkholderia TaxID=1822464 RepID=UPI00038084F4|nr:MULTISPECIES: hydroxyacid dehydrogenase [Paraburkholderia]MDH6147042.1 (S)-sulfolactate dehydrogenase [Paraburkholderia sp. WSM4179]